MTIGWLRPARFTLKPSPNDVTAQEWYFAPLQLVVVNTGAQALKIQMRKRPGKLPTLDTMGSNLVEDTDLEFNWRRNGLRTLRPNPLECQSQFESLGPKIKPRKLLI